MKDVDAIIEENVPLVKSIAASLDAAQDDDAVQSGMIGLWEAAERWDGERPFRPLARKCIRCNIIDYIRGQRPDAQLEYDVEADTSLSELMEDDAYFHSLIRELFSRRSRERRCLELLIRGESKASIAARLGVSKRTVQRILVSAWDKLQKRKAQDL